MNVLLQWLLYSPAQPYDLGIRYLLFSYDGILGGIDSTVPMMTRDEIWWASTLVKSDDC